MPEAAGEVRALDERVGLEPCAQVAQHGVEVHFGGGTVEGRDRERGEHHLAPGLEPLAELARALEAPHQVGGDGLAALVVAREGREHAGIPGPLLEQLGGHLDEVGLGLDARDPGPALPAREQAVEQVAELVEQRAHVAVLEQAGIAGLAAGEVADQRGLGDLAAGHAAAHVELRRVAVLVGARVHVEVEAPDHLPALHHLPALDRRVPHRRVRAAAKAHAEQPRREVEHALEHALERQVGPHLARVEVVLGAAHLLGHEAGLPGLNHRGARVVRALAAQQGLGVGRGARPRDLDDALHERARGGGALDHLVRGHVVRPVGEAEQGRELVALRDQALEHRLVRGIGAVVELEVHAAAQVVARGVEEHRGGVGVVDGERDRAVRAGGMAGDEVRGQPLELARVRDRDPALVGADVAGELLPDRHQLVRQLAHPLPGGLVAVHAREPEFPQRLLDVVPGGAVRARQVERRERVVHPAVERQLGAVGRGALRHLLGGVAQRRVGVHVLDQRGRRAGGLELDQGVVVGTQGVLERARPAHREQARDRRARALETLRRASLERGGIGGAGPERGVALGGRGP